MLSDRSTSLTAAKANARLLILLLLVLAAAIAALAFLGFRRRGAKAEVAVVAEGATGTGKTFVARSIHQLSPRHSRLFVAVDPGTLTHHYADLLLFGREPGRGGQSRTGLIERANGGALLIDEVETASSALNARQLSVLSTRSVLPAGTDRPRQAELPFRGHAAIARRSTTS